MQQLLLLGALLSSGSALALNGTPRPDWIGKSVRSATLPHSGQPTVYVFAQPDCASCSLQLGALSALQKSHPKLQVVLVTEQNSAALREYLAGFTLQPTIHADTAGQSIQALGLKTIPAVMYVNAAGIVQGFYEGTLTNAETRELGTALLAGKPVPRLTVPGGVGSPAPALPGVNWASSRNHLVIFHSASCRFCTDQLPHLLKYARENPKVAVWIVALGELEVVKKQFAGAPRNVRIVEDQSNVNAGVKLASAYRAQGTPIQFLVSSAGTIKWRGEGFDAVRANPFQAGKLPLE
ncbi:TlpA family protein disulfide reductase [Deinococcus murrayi]|uniref:TlpA family protein disulfide reductase n=1 Tax=Deinococcus murrayi TaxID=68910 RepID=UPI0004865578|nr:redoxin domain-containing protein [Deinococcus murrayi]